MQPLITLHFLTPKLKLFHFVFLLFFSFFPGKSLNINNIWKASQSALSSSQNHCKN